MILPDSIPRFFPHFIFFFQRLFPDSICPFLLVAFIRDVGYWRLLPCVSGLFCPQGLLVRRKATASPSTKLWFLYHFTKRVFFTLQAFCDSKSSETLLSIWSRDYLFCAIMCFRRKLCEKPYDQANFKLHCKS